MEIDGGVQRRKEVFIEEDESERRERVREQQELMQQEMEKRRSSVYQRRQEFPKPNISKDFASVISDSRKSLPLEQKLIDDEMLQLIKRDLVNRDDDTFYRFSSEQLNAAKALIDEETGNMPDSFLEEFLNARAEIIESMKSKDVNSKKAEYEALFSRMETESKKCSKLERKVALLTEGYRKRSEGLYKKLSSLHEELIEKRNTLNAYELMDANESIGAPLRIQRAMELAELAKTREADLQNAYAAAL